LEQIVGFERAKVAAGLMVLAPFIPMLFQGEEFAASTPFQYFADHDDPEMARSVSDGRRREFEAFGWDPAVIPDPERLETFERSKLRWDEAMDGKHADMTAWYCSLIRFRRSSSSLNDGDPSHLQVEFDEGKRWLMMGRGKVRVIANLGGTPVEFPNYGDLQLVLASCGGVVVDRERVLVPADGLAVVVLGGGIDSALH
jgi:maltooligosyltrehalose trehalohydrolase